MTKKLASIVIAAIVAASIAQPSHAFGASLPYVSDVNPYGKGYTVTVEVAGSEKNFDVRMVDAKTRKAVKVDRVGKHVFMARIKANRTYIIKARGITAKRVKAWKAISYRIYK